jgi:hypothetical protein
MKLGILYTALLLNSVAVYASDTLDEVSKILDRIYPLQSEQPSQISSIPNPFEGSKKRSLDHEDDLLLYIYSDAASGSAYPHNVEFLRHVLQVENEGQVSPTLRAAIDKVKRFMKTGNGDPAKKEPLLKELDVQIVSELLNRSGKSPDKGKLSSLDTRISKLPRNIQTALVPTIERIKDDLTLAHWHQAKQHIDGLTDLVDALSAVNCPADAHRLEPTQTGTGTRSHVTTPATQSARREVEPSGVIRPVSP